MRMLPRIVYTYYRGGTRKLYFLFDVCIYGRREGLWVCMHTDISTCRCWCPQASRSVISQEQETSTQFDWEGNSSCYVLLHPSNTCKRYVNLLPDQIFTIVKALSVSQKDIYTFTQTPPPPPKSMPFHPQKENTPPPAFCYSLVGCPALDYVAK